MFKILLSFCALFWLMAPSEQAAEPHRNSKDFVSFSPEEVAELAEIDATRALTIAYQKLINMKSVTLGDSKVPLNLHEAMTEGDWDTSDVRDLVEYTWNNALQSQMKKKQVEDYPDPVWKMKAKFKICIRALENLMALQPVFVDPETKEKGKSVPRGFLPTDPHGFVTKRYITRKEGKGDAATLIPAALIKILKGTPAPLDSLWEEVTSSPSFDPNAINSRFMSTLYIDTAFILKQLYFATSLMNTDIAFPEICPPMDNDENFAVNDKIELFAQQYTAPPPSHIATKINKAVDIFCAHCQNVLDNLLASNYYDGTEPRDEVTELGQTEIQTMATRAWDKVRSNSEPINPKALFHIYVLGMQELVLLNTISNAERDRIFTAYKNWGNKRRSTIPDAIINLVQDILYPKYDMSDNLNTILQRFVQDVLNKHILNYDNETSSVTDLLPNEVLRPLSQSVAFILYKIFQLRKNPAAA